MKKIDNLTGIRAFAALWVALLHFSGNTGIADHWDVPKLISGGAFGVDVFFVLSGFVISMNYLDSLRTDKITGTKMRSYLVKRFARIYPLHLVTFLMMVFVVGVANYKGYQFKSDVEYTTYTAFLNIFLLQAWHGLSWNGVSWSVSAEWFAYLVLFPICVHSLNKQRLATIGFLVSMIWLACMGFIIFELKEHISKAEYGIARVIPEFLAGYFAYKAAPLIRWNGGLLIGIGLVFLAAIVHLPVQYELLILPAIVSLILGLYVGGQYTDRLFGNKVFVFLGEISFSVYMVHPFIKTASDQIMRAIPSWNTKAHFPLLLAANIAATLLAATLAYYVVEVPGRKWLVSTYQRKRSSGVGAIESA